MTLQRDQRACGSCGTVFEVDSAKAEEYEATAECPEWFCFDCGGELL